MFNKVKILSIYSIIYKKSSISQQKMFFSLPEAVSDKKICVDFNAPDISYNGGLLLVRTSDLHLPLPVGKLLELLLVMLAKRSHDSLNKTGQLSLANTRRTPQKHNLTAESIIFVVVKYEFNIRQMDRKCRFSSKHHLTHVF